MIWSISEATRQLLTIYDNVICFVFLADFGLRLKRAPTKRQYFIGERGWLDLLGSIPSFGLAPFGRLLRLARLSRLARVMRLLGGQKKKEIMADVLAHRGQYAAFMTIMAASVVLVVASILAGFLVGPSEPEPEAEPVADLTGSTTESFTESSPAVQYELRAIRAELESLRQTLGT
jgi:hypothetical protein